MNHIELTLAQKQYYLDKIKNVFIKDRFSVTATGKSKQRLGIVKTNYHGN
jgi:hypothetical protein